MSFSEKILKHSNSYNFYKTNYNALYKNNKKLKEEIKKYKLKENKDKNANKNFCEISHLDFYFDEDFEKYFYNMTKNLDSKSKHFFKFLFLRSLTLNFNKQKTLFSDEELKNQKLYDEFRNTISENQVGEFKFINNFYEIPCLMDSGLNEEDKELIKNKDIIDAGAYTGDSALLLSTLTSKNVYGFEPYKKSYEIMKENIVLNKIDNIIPICAALGDIEKNTKLYIGGYNNLGVTFNPRDIEYDGESDAQVLTIDDYVEKNNLDVGFIKIDVEGSEQELLKGAINTIKTQKPILFISIYHKVEDLFQIKPWIESLDLGYEFKISKEHPYCFIAGTILECRAKH